MDITLLRDFEELEGLNDAEDADVDTGAGEDDDDPSFKPVNVQTLAQNDIVYELEKRAIKPTGFPDTDKDILQKEFDKEFIANLEEAKAKRKEAKRRAAMQAGLQKRRVYMETSLQEEQDELAANRQVGLVIDMIKENQADASLRLDVNSVAARVLTKAMWLNTSITCLDLSSNNLNDHAGAYLARILKRNQTLRKIELDNNFLGPKASAAFGEALLINSSLVYLSLDSNPLCNAAGGMEDSAGVVALAESLRENKTLTSLNLWRATVTQKGGVALASAIQSNSSILFCEVGHNLIAMAETVKIAERLDANLAAYEARERSRRKQIAADASSQADAQAIANQLRKEKEQAEWLQSRLEQRAEARRIKAEDRIREQQEAEAEILRQAAQEKAAAKAKAEEDGGKGKGKGKGKK